MDFTLDDYIKKYNDSLSIIQRKGVVLQRLKAFDYIHSKKRLHRDISPKNILIKKYEDLLVVKISDFGLVRIPDSPLTATNTEFKGYFNDPSLVVDGFNTYDISHEIFALTRVVYFVMTGKTNIDSISEPNMKTFVTKGLNTDKTNTNIQIDRMIH